MPDRLTFVAMGDIRGTGRALGLFLGVSLLAIVGCTDKAKGPFKEGEAARVAKNHAAAVAKYREAVEADPDSEHGQKAAKQLAVVEAEIKQQNAEAEAKKQEAAEAAAREKLLNSDEPADWKGLVEKYPKSVEATKAKQKLAKNASLCGDLASWTDRINKETTELKSVVKRYKGRNQLASSPMELLKVSGAMAKQCSGHAERLDQSLARLEKHGLSKGEDKIHLELKLALMDLSAMWKIYKKAFNAGTDGFAKLLKTDAYIQSVVAPKNRKLVRKLKSKCVRMASGQPGETEAEEACSPCASQEDFDAALRRKSKCCPVIGCRGDADCSGGRVCCEIPDGQLCADAHRCASVNRVP